MPKNLVHGLQKVIFGTTRFSGKDWSTGLGIVVIVGIIIIVLDYLFSTANVSLTVSLLLGGASLLIGVLLGFLFGIPRSLQLDNAEQSVGEPRPEGGGDRPPASNRISVRYGANTNLEQISDWLTKILVGVGLTQIGNIAGYLEDIGSYFSTGGLGPQLAVVIVLYFLVSGFLFGYLWTRLFLGSELAEADLRAVSERVQRFEEAQEVQSQTDARAISLVSQYLTADDVSKISVEELKEAVRNASAPVKVQIFYQAEAVRRESWRRPEKRYLLDRTVPIFQALAESDREKRFHKNFGQLGFALKDTREPDYAAARDALSEAIRIRGPATEAGYELYEFNRAICMIKLDMAFTEGKPSAPDMQEQIMADISIARQLIPDLHNDETLMEWLKLNPQPPRP